MVRLGVEPRTSRVWGERDNHYTTEPTNNRGTILKSNPYCYVAH